MRFWTVMPDLHSRLGYSSKLSRNCKRDEVRTNVDIHTLVRELQDRHNSRKSRDSRELKKKFPVIKDSWQKDQELNKNVITVPSVMKRDILVFFDSGLIYRHVSERFETRQEQVENLTDKTNVPFTLLFSSRAVLTRM